MSATFLEVYFDCNVSLNMVEHLRTFDVMHDPILGVHEGRLAIALEWCERCQLSDVEAIVRDVDPEAVFEVVTIVKTVNRA